MYIKKNQNAKTEVQNGEFIHKLYHRPTRKNVKRKEATAGIIRTIAPSFA